MLITLDWLLAYTPVFIGGKMESHNGGRQFPTQHHLFTRVPAS